MTQASPFPLRVLLRARGIRQAVHERPPHHKGRRSAERRVVPAALRTSGAPPVLRMRRAPLLADALAFRRSTAALAKVLSILAQSGPALHGSDDMRYPGSQLLADLRRGRPGEFPNRPRMELRAPFRAPLPLASIGRHRLTSLRTSRTGRLLVTIMDLTPQDPRYRFGSVFEDLSHVERLCRPSFSVPRSRSRMA